MPCRRVLFANTSPSCRRCAPTSIGCVTIWNRPVRGNWRDCIHKAADGIGGPAAVELISAAPSFDIARRANILDNAPS
jgi:hypothetical protein